MANERVCSVEGCGKPYRARDLCAIHYRRMLRYGSTEYRGNASPARDFFLNIVLECDQDECLTWPYYRSEKGYGRMRWEEKDHYVHRLADQILNGMPSNPNYDAAHTCGNGHLGCCNPKHVKRCTRAENRSHMIEHGTLQTGETVPSSRLTNKQVLQIKDLLGKIPQTEIAQRFGVGKSTIWSIRAGRSWSHLTGFKRKPLGRSVQRLHAK